MYFKKFDHSVKVCVCYQQIFLQDGKQTKFYITHSVISTKTVLSAVNSHLGTEKQCFNTMSFSFHFLSLSIFYTQRAGPTILYFVAWVHKT